MSQPRTKCAGSIPGGGRGCIPGSLRRRGGDDIMPGWLRQPWRRRARRDPSRARPGRQRPGSAPRAPNPELRIPKLRVPPAPHPELRAPPGSQQWALLKPIVSTVRGFRSYFAAQKSEEGGEKKPAHNDPFIQTRKACRKYKVFPSLIQKPLKSTEALSIFSSGHWRRL